MTEVVLSGSLTESARFIKDHDLSRAARHYGSGNSLLGANPHEVHILSSFWRRRDVHSFRRHVKTIQRRSKSCRFNHYDDEGNLFLVDVAWLPDGDISVRERVPSIREQLTAPDTSKDAVQGQIALGELEDVLQDPEDDWESEGGSPGPVSADEERFLDGSSTRPNPEATPSSIRDGYASPRVDPDDDFLAFLED